MFKKQFVTLAIGMLAALTLGVSAVWAQIVEPDEHGFMIAGPEDLRPTEGRSVVLYGNPQEEGLYVIQITWEPGSGSRPHYHDQARYITVLKGHWYVSSGPESDIYDPDNMQRIPPGTFIYQPPYGHHYDMAKDEEVIVQITGMGPVTTTSIPQP